MGARIHLASKYEEADYDWPKTPKHGTQDHASLGTISQSHGPQADHAVHHDSTLSREGQDSINLALLMFWMTLSPSYGRLLPCPSAGGHFSTFFRTAAAGLGAAAAMVVLVLFAFRGTGVANRGADAAELRDESGIPAHECRAGPALVRAIDAEPRAFRHLAETLIAARFAFFRASDTGFHTGLILMSHERISFMLIGLRNKRAAHSDLRS